MGPERTDRHTEQMQGKTRSTCVLTHKDFELNLSELKDRISLSGLGFYYRSIMTEASCSLICGKYR